MEVTPTSFERQRNYLKCDNCRRRHRKCEPEDRPWQLGHFQPCRPCAVSKIFCGPNRFKARSSSSAASLPHDVLGAPFTPQASFPQPPGQHSLDPAALGHYLSPPSTDHYGPYDSSLVAAADFSPELGSIIGDNQDPIYARLTFDSAVSQTAVQGANVPLFVPGPCAAKTKPIIRSRLEELGTYRDVYADLKNNQDAHMAAQPARKYPEFAEIGHGLATALFYIKDHFIRGCEQAHAQIQQSQAHKELYLRRLLENMESFQSISRNATRGSGDDKRVTHLSARLKSLHANVCTTLISLYDELEDHSEADHFRTKIVQPEPDTNTSSPQVIYEFAAQAHVPDRFVRRSQRVSKAFHALNLQDLCSFASSESADFPPVQLAVRNGDTVAACALLGQSYDLGKSVDILQRMPGHWAAETGNMELLHAFLEHDLDVQHTLQRDVYHMTPLCVAAYANNLIMFQRLHKAGYSLNDRDVIGRSVLTIACGAGCIDIVRYILQQGVSPSESFGLEKGRSYSALHAAAAGGHREIAKLLLRKGASAVYVCHDRTPSQEAEEYGHNELAKLLQNAFEVEANKLEPGAAGVLSKIRKELSTSMGSPEIAHQSPGISHRADSRIGSPQLSVVSEPDLRSIATSQGRDLPLQDAPRKRPYDDHVGSSVHSLGSRSSSRASSRHVRTRMSPLRPAQTQ